MSSNRLLVSSVHGQTLGQASQGFSCTEKYDWHNLTLCQSEQAITEQPDHDATLHYPLNIHTREYTASHGQGHSSEIHGSGNGLSGPYCLTSCSYGRCHGKDRGCLGNPSKQASRSISPGRDPFLSHRSRSPYFNHVPRRAKGADRQISQAGSCRKKFSANQGCNSQNRHYDDDRYLPTRLDFMDDHFSEVDAERRRSYMRNFHSSSEQKGNAWKDPTSSHGRLCQRHELARAHPKRLHNEFRSHHHEQLELSPNADFRESLDGRRNFRSAYNGKMAKRKFVEQGFHENTYDGACTSKCRNIGQKRKADHLGGKKARKNMADEEKPENLCWPSEKDQQEQVETDRKRNDSLEGSAEITKFVCQNGGKGNCDPKKNATAPDSSCPTKCDENSNSAKCSKTITSSNTPGLSEGSADMDLESDKQSDVDGCTERGILQHLPVTHTGRNVQLKESHNLSQSEALRQDCLNLWKARQLRKATAAKADRIVKSNQQQTGQRSKVSTGRRVRDGRPAAFATSESDNEDDSALVCSDQLSSATSSDGIQKCGEGKANQKLEKSLKFSSNSKYNVTAEKELECSLKLPLEANPFELAQLKEKEKNLNSRKLSTDHPDAKVHSGLNYCCDTSKVDQVAVPHCDSRVRNNISQQEIHNAYRRKEILGGHGAKWAEPTLPDQEPIARCSMDGNSMVNELKTPEHLSGNTPMYGSVLDRGAANMYQKKPVNMSSESYCRDLRKWLGGNDHTDNQQGVVDHNLLRKEQVCSLLADSENELNENDTKACEPQALRVDCTSAQWVTTEDCNSNVTHSVSAKRSDLIRCSSIPDLNCSPVMVSVEDFVASKEPVCQVTAGCFISQNVTKSLSASLTGAIVKEEQYEKVFEEQCKPAEANQITKEVCKKEGTSEVATQLEISESNTGPPHPQRSAVEESGASMDAFRCALCEFVKNFIKPLWDKGLLSREVHKIVVKKAVEKVADAWASNAPSTELAISRIVSDEAKNKYREACSGGTINPCPIHH
ncbi:hypothetical protein HU200_045463 [Digitaria exilis]|uniref:Uncharacterized protein n=1 Tax=Digitaria exilis TaxID=1010633 RepID=A0A835BBM4_9POAL|nr:hypothetical protein HU200_045463 [Digitaria exilis]